MVMLRSVGWDDRRSLVQILLDILLVCFVAWDGAVA